MSMRLKKKAIVSLILASTGSLHLLQAMENPRYENELNCVFPNYFIFLDNDNKNRIVEDSFSSILNRLKMPYVDLEKKTLTDCQFMKNLNDYSQTLVPGAKLYISGGVVRSLLGYLYKKCYNAHHRFLFDSINFPNAKTVKEVINETFDQIIEGKSWKNPQSMPSLLPSLRALGINSDLDILIEFPDSFIGDKKDVRWKITDFINSAEHHLGLRDDKGATKKSIIPVGDVKDYHEQLGNKGKRSAVSQGGSTLDWLAFPINANEPQVMRHPEGHETIFNDFLEGKIEYLKALTGMKDLDKQTVRGLRPFLEIPFLIMDNNSSKIMQDELNLLIKKVENSNDLSRGAIEQFEKLVRNARFEGAHNRFFKMIEHMPNPEINELVQTLSSCIGKQGAKSLPLIPEFLVNKKIIVRTDDKENLAVQGKLISLEDFIQKYTNNGIIYHGTPDLNNILYMIRNGLVVSSDKQGTAVYGRGTYAAKDEDVPKEYAGLDGIVIGFQINNQKNLRILDLNTEYGSELVEEIKVTYPEQDPHQILEEKYDIDIIIASGGYILLQNVDAIKIPKNVSMLIQSQIEKQNTEILEQLKNENFELVDADIKNWMKITHPSHGYQQFMLYLNPNLQSRNFETFTQLVKKWFGEEAFILEMLPILQDHYKDFDHLYGVLETLRNSYDCKDDIIENLNLLLGKKIVFESYYFKQLIPELKNPQITDLVVLMKNFENNKYHEFQIIEIIKSINKCNYEDNFLIKIKKIIGSGIKIDADRIKSFIQKLQNDQITDESINSLTRLNQIVLIDFFDIMDVLQALMGCRNHDVLIANIENLSKLGIKISIYDIKDLIREFQNDQINNEAINSLTGLKQLISISLNDVIGIIKSLGGCSNHDIVISNIKKLIDSGFYIHTSYLSYFMNELKNDQFTDETIDSLKKINCIFRSDHCIFTLESIKIIRKLEGCINFDIAIINLAKLIRLSNRLGIKGDVDRLVGFVKELQNDQITDEMINSVTRRNETVPNSFDDIVEHLKELITCSTQCASFVMNNSVVIPDLRDS